jgi:Cu2+-exporting ATPase/Cu+-exporting ATPase
VASFEDKLKSEAKQTISMLTSCGKVPWIISGDQKDIAHAVGAELGVDEDKILYEVSPLQKSSVIDEHPYSIMVGDGLNDLMAIGAASVGVAMGGQIEANLKVSDVSIPSGKLTKLISLFNEAYSCKKIIKRNLLISVGYNIFGITACLLGYIGPLGAAILMPISSISVVISTFISTKKEAKTWK